LSRSSDTLITFAPPRFSITTLGGWLHVRPPSADSIDTMRAGLWSAAPP